MDTHSLCLPVIIEDQDKSSALKNRIKKNYRHIRKWAKRSCTDCFRIYDRDIKEYPLAIDFYAGRFSVQFFSYDRDYDEPSPELKEEVDQILRSLFNITSDLIYWRTRIKRRKTEQYEKRDDKEDFFTVFEYGAKFKVNLNDYLDTGLFLDHREMRRLVFSIAKEKRVLNLFSYTCSFSVLAALAGAFFTKSVDLSNTYTRWGKENFILNSLSAKNNEIIREDCMRFLEDEVHTGSLFDIIIIDPPTISRSKKMDQMFDVQIDYVFLIKKALKILFPNGVIFFSTNSKRFKLDESLLKECLIKDITSQTFPLDFNKKIHKCWKITHKP